MRIILDTSVLWNKRLLNELATMPNEIIVPAVVFAERARQFRKNGFSVRDLQIILHANGFQIESLSAQMATKYCSEIIDDDDWKKLSRDSLIAGHIKNCDQLWTSNPKDFIKLGVDEANILSC